MSNTHKDKHKDKRREHMERRREHGVTYRDMEKDFGVSKSKLHRDLQKDED
jgi:predicted transcriptional regulator